MESPTIVLVLMGWSMKALPFSSSTAQNYCCPPTALGLSSSKISIRPHAIKVGVWAKSGKDEEEEEPKRPKQSLFGSVTEALDFSQVRSAEDAVLLDQARQATKTGGKMSREQYGALRRKIGGTYKDFFKSYVEVEGEYVEEGWVDKTCKVCKGDTRGEERQVDRFGKYVHVACLEKSKPNNFFSKLFSQGFTFETKISE